MSHERLAPRHEVGSRSTGCSPAPRTHSHRSSAEGILPGQARQPLESELPAAAARSEHNSCALWPECPGTECRPRLPLFCPEPAESSDKADQEPRQAQRAACSQWPRAPEPAAADQGLDAPGTETARRAEGPEAGGSSDFSSQKCHLSISQPMSRC